MLDVTPPGVLAVVLVEVVATVVLGCIDVVILLVETPPEGVLVVPKLVGGLGMVGNNEGCQTPGALAAVGCGICYV